ncbi:hypothetical protein OIU78_025507 [Salix suchowensis]|nr:hypothetical protein OIU78_025507 [Salix suchowensis]
MKFSPAKTEGKFIKKKIITTVPLLTLQADTIRNTLFAASADSFLEIPPLSNH